MGNYAHEISQKENDERLILIDLHNGRCPVCNRTYLTRIEDERHARGFEQGIHILLCDKCGVVARENVNYMAVRPNVYFQGRILGKAKFDPYDLDGLVSIHEFEIREGLFV